MTTPRPKAVKRSHIQIVAIHVSCPHCGSPDVSTQMNHSLMFTADDRVGVCLDCGQLCIVPERIFA